MNDLKFGFVEIDTSREINRWRLEIDRVLFRKSLLISEDGMAKFWQKNWTAEMHEKRQQCRSIDASYFFRRICNKKKIFLPKNRHLKKAYDWVRLLRT